MATPEAQAMEARFMQVLNEARREMAEQMQANQAQTAAEITALRGLATAQDTEGRGLVAQLADARGQLAAAQEEAAASAAQVEEFRHVVIGLV